MLALRSPELATKQRATYRPRQTNIRAPKRWADRALPDGYRWGRWWEALLPALARIIDGGVAAPRVLAMGAGGGMLPLMALRAGAGHVVCAERCDVGTLGLACWSTAVD